jgi:hypothetical protein
MLKLDLSKAFDTLPWWLVRDALMWAGVPAHLVEFVLRSLRVSQYHVQHPAWDEYVRLTPGRGVTHGRPDGPDIFAIGLRFLLRDLWDLCQTEGLGLPLRGGVCLPWLAYVDYIVVLATRANAAQRIGNLLLRALRAGGLTFNMSKFQWVLSRQCAARMHKSRQEASTLPSLCRTPMHGGTCLLSKPHVLSTTCVPAILLRNSLPPMSLGTSTLRAKFVALWLTHS